MPQDSPTPASLGPVITEQGVSFSLYSEHATAVELCLFDSADADRETRTLPLEKRPDSVWHVHVAGLNAGALYGFRVHGPYRPAEGHRFNPSKLLIDPWARALGRPMVWHESLQSVPLEAEDHPDHPPNTQDSAACAPLARVIDTAFDWQDDRAPDIPWDDTIIYEAHVKGISRQHPGVPEPLRGTFAGLASEPVLDHLTKLGVTTVELLPVTQSADELHLHQMGLTNYWGYNPLLPFAPDIRLASAEGGGPVFEFKQMVQTLHRAGFEVILDLVFNHTAEGDLWGPTVSFRGIDNFNYYRTGTDDRSRYIDFTGCGNTLNLHHPRVRQWVLDCLRYWITEMHVDGFRLDLAVTVGRGREAFEPEGEFFRSIAQDPVLSQAKWIAEPWDLGPEGYQLSRFPREWSEWNDQFRQTVRRYWRGDPGLSTSLARRVSGSRDWFTGRSLHASLNYVTSHDGFTLQDLVSYEQKHNEANGEDNRDGSHGNDSCNYGSEGPSDDPELNALRLRQKKNLMATLLLSSGIPMLSGGDEIGRTQEGNNNAYCQDNTLSWHHWNLDASQREFLEFTRSLIGLRKSHRWHQAERQWFRPDGQRFDIEEDLTPEGPGMACRLSGLSSTGKGEHWVFWNEGPYPVEFLLPEEYRPGKVLVGTCRPDSPHVSEIGKSLKTLVMPGGTLMVLEAFPA